MDVYGMEFNETRFSNIFPQKNTNPSTSSRLPSQPQATTAGQRLVEVFDGGIPA